MDEHTRILISTLILFGVYMSNIIIQNLFGHIYNALNIKHTLVFQNGLIWPRQWLAQPPELTKTQFGSSFILEKWYPSPTIVLFDSDNVKSMDTC